MSRAKLTTTKGIAAPPSCQPPNSAPTAVAVFFGVGIVQVIFGLAIALVLYPYALYPALLWLVTRFVAEKEPSLAEFNPSITVIIPAFNEAAFLRKKVENTRAQNYPSDKLEIIIVTDGSTDESPDIATDEIGANAMHEPERKGKMNAMQRAAKIAKHDIIVFTDANAMLNPDALLLLAAHFQNQKVGLVAGKKIVGAKINDGGQATSEANYWQLENTIKALEQKANLTVFAVGELFAIRKKIFTSIQGDPIADDMAATIQTIAQGFQVRYEPNATAHERGSATWQDELNRKRRILKGGLQQVKPIWRTFSKRDKIAFISHKLIRWTISPFAILTILLLMPILVYHELENNLESFPWALALLLVTGGLTHIVLPKISKAILAFIYINLTLATTLVLGNHRKITTNWSSAKRIQTP